MLEPQPSLTRHSRVHPERRLWLEGRKVPKLHLTLCFNCSTLAANEIQSSTPTHKVLPRPLQPFPQSPAVPSSPLMFQLCVVWLCLLNLKDALVKGGRGPGTFYGDGGEGGAFPVSVPATPSSHFPWSGPISLHFVVPGAGHRIPHTAL